MSMPSNFVAHSSPKDKPSKPPHLYSDHIHGVEQLGMEFARRLFDFSSIPKEETSKLKKSLRLALRAHDIGKLESGNQGVLSGISSGRLLYDHVDSGVAVALGKQDKLAAWLIRAHHFPGLTSVHDERALVRRRIPLLRGKRKRNCFSRDHINKHEKLIEKTNALSEDLISKHQESCGHELTGSITGIPEDSLTVRLLLSCLVDSDHSDTAAYYAENYVEKEIPSSRTRWDERLVKLENYISELEGKNSERKKLRDELFYQCRDHPSRAAILTCAAPVGLGKTTAVLANLLSCAKEKNLRRIFVVAPYTNIIKQTVNSLRMSLVLEGEDPHAIVAEHHHRADFDSPALRQYTQLWKAPIVITTAVQFFETLASASPSSIRKLHELPGSAIFIDESHACVPATLMRQTWYWIRQLSQCWSCHFVLASGSLIKFWESDEIVGKDEQISLPSLLKKNFFAKTQVAEQKRVEFCRLNNGSSITKTELLEHIRSDKVETGSKLLICNTVQSAAVIARDLQPQEETDGELCLSGRSVLHLSTALTPSDRERVIKEIEARQSNDRWKNRNWYLVATSCVEAGVDLDFNFGYRERCSVTSFLQTAGRVNREGLNKNGVLYDFLLQESEGITKHPAFGDSAKVFDYFWEEISKEHSELDQLSTRALVEEIRRGESNDQFVSRLLKYEKCCDFQQVQEKFKIITSASVTAIVSCDLKDRISKGIPVPHREIQRNSVQIWSNKIEKYHLEPCDFGRELYFWNYGYDPDVLGYMKDLDMMLKKGGAVI